MKHSIFFLFILMLFSSTLQAKYLRATLFMENGVIKKGLAEKVQSTDSKVNFKTDDGSKIEKIASREIKRIEFEDADGTTYIAENLYAVTANILSGKFSRSSKKKWFYMIYDKNARIGYITETGSNRPNAGGTSRVITYGNTAYFFGKKDSEELVFGYSESSGSNLAVGTDSLIRKMAAEAFGDCPQIMDAIPKTDFSQTQAIDQLKAIFEHNTCP